MNARREKLALALKLAKQQLNETGTGLHKVTVQSNKNSQPSLSKMNRLIGKQDVQDQRQGTLLQRTGIVERPTFDVVADKVLGKESKRRRPALDLTTNGDSLADIAARRIRSLRQRTYEQIEQGTEETEDGYFGMEEDGRPVWERILDDQRGRLTVTLPPELAPVDSNSPFHHEVVVPTEGVWPPRLRPEIRMSFKQWFITDENFRATQAAEAVVDSPGGTLNPLMFVGPSETGRSHLLHATAQAVLRRQEGNVYLLSTADLSGLERLPDGWQDTLVNARLLAIDDLHEHAQKPELAHELGTMLDYALNMGVHVLLSSNSEPDDWPASRLWELGGTLNPLMFVGPSETGRSHLLHATAQAVLRRQEGNVYLLSTADLSGLERLPDGWQDTLVNARLLAIDDLHEHAQKPELAHELGTMLDYALNMGVHVLLSSNSEPDDWPASRLWELTRHAASVHLETPKSASMVLYARNLAQKKGFMMDDGQLTSIVLQDTIGWRATKANFDLVALALQSGQSVLDGDDVTALLSNQMNLREQMVPDVRENVEEIAARLVTSAVDTIYSDTVHGGIDLYSELPEIGDDLYQPPEIDTQALTEDSDARHAAYLKIALEDTEPAASSVLALHEREDHLITRKGHIEERDHGLAADLLTELDQAFDSQIHSFETDMRQSSLQLAQIEAKLVNMADRTPEASLDELILIADELRALEENLIEVDPEHEPWPKMESETPSKKKRKVGRRKSTPPVEPLESHEPKGEWNIDAKDVDMSDLLEAGEKPRKIRLGRINSHEKILRGEEK